MKVVYVRSAVPDVIWFRAYYESIFPEGEREALQQRRAVERLLRENPFVGRLLQDHSGVRIFPVSRTPFLMVYRVSGDRIEVLRLWDGRRDPADFQY